MTLRKYLYKRFGSTWLFAIVFWLFFIATAILLSQFFLPPDNSPEDNSIVEFYDNVFEQFFRTETDGTITAIHKNLWNQSFRSQKPENTRRFFVVGGSVAQNLGQSIHAQIFTNALCHIYPDNKIEIINAGLTGFDSFRALRIVKEIVRYKPDCLIILSGNNEFYPQPLTLGHYWFYQLRKVHLLRLFINRHNHHAGTRTIEQKLGNYEINIEEMVSTAKKHSTEVILCTLPLNLSQFAPNTSFPTEKEYIRGSFFFWHGHWDAAYNEMRRYTDQNPKSALGHYMLGQIRDRQGQKTQADAFFDTALNLDYGNHDRACAKSNTIIRQIARRTQTALADLDAEFRKLRTQDIRQETVFRDTCHITEKYTPIIFNTILKTIDSGNRPIKKQEFTGCDNGAQEHIVIFAALSINPKHEFLNAYLLSRFRAAYLIEGAEKINSLLQDKPGLEEKIKNLIGTDADETDFSRIYMNAGEAFRRLGEQEHALAFLNKAQETSTQKDWRLPLSLALLMHEKGQKTQAQEYIEQALSFAAAEEDACTIITEFKNCMLIK